MGQYIDVVDVEAYVPARAPFTATSRPSASQVSQLISDVEGDIHAAMILAGYPVPVPAAATAALQQVRTAAKRGAAAMVERVAPTSQDREPSLRLWTTALKMLKDGQLPDYPKTGADVQPRQGPDAGSELNTVSVDMLL
jgi:hypothetical protein